MVLYEDNDQDHVPTNNELSERLNYLLKQNQQILELLKQKDNKTYVEIQQTKDKLKEISELKPIQCAIESKKNQDEFNRTMRALYLFFKERYHLFRIHFNQYINYYVCLTLLFISIGFTLFGIIAKYQCYKELCVNYEGKTLCVLNSYCPKISEHTYWGLLLIFVNTISLTIIIFVDNPNMAEIIEKLKKEENNEKIENIGIGDINEDKPELTNNTKNEHYK
jgi:hypothetical protein